MQYRFLALATIVSLLAFPSIVKAELEVATKGAKIGEWTQDYDAALKLAKEKNIPIFMNFTGSDWCTWCKVMDRKVFGTEEWESYAADSLVLVTLDFPRDETIVPEEYVERNKTLKRNLGAKGFPIYILMESDGTTELGRLGAAEEISPEAFGNEIDAILRYRPEAISKYVKTLPQAAQKEYLALIAERTNNISSVAENRAKIISYQDANKALKESFDELKDKTRSFRAAQRGADVLKKYESTKENLELAIKELDAWLETKPPRSPENNIIFKDSKQKIQDLRNALTLF